MSDAEKKEILEKENGQDVDEGALNEVSGGTECGCAFGGGGVGNDMGTPCACVIGGGGEWNEKGQKEFKTKTRCVCVFGGAGNAPIN